MNMFSDMRVAVILTKVDLLDKEIKKDIRKADKHRKVKEVLYIKILWFFCLFLFTLENLPVKHTLF